MERKASLLGERGSWGRIGWGICRGLDCTIRFCLLCDCRDVQWRWNSASGVDDFSIGFSFNGIKEFAKAKKLADLISIKISQMCPLCATYALDNASYVSYYLAPREL